MFKFGPINEFFLFVLKIMATIKLTVLKNTRAKDGSFKICISIGHKQETRYIVTKYKVQNFSDFSNGSVVRVPNAHEMNIKLRNLLNDCEERFEVIHSPDEYSCKELRDLLKSMRPIHRLEHLTKYLNNIKKNSPKMVGVHTLQCLKTLLDYSIILTVVICFFHRLVLSPYMSLNVT